MAGLGDHELDVGMRDVAGQVFALPGVIESGHGHPDQPGATEREHVVGRVVQQDADVWRPTGVEPGAEECGESLRFGEQLRVRPHLISEAKSGTAGVAFIEAVASEEGRDVRGREGHLGEWRSERR